MEQLYSCLSEQFAEQAGVFGAVFPEFRTHVDEYGVFADYLNVTPADNNILLTEKQPKQPAFAVNNQGYHFCGNSVHFYVRNISKAAAVPYIYHFFITQISYTAKHTAHLPV